MLSNALCVARVELRTAVCAHLRVSMVAPLLTTHLGLARALVAIARQSGKTRDASTPDYSTLLEIDRVAALPDGTVVQELAVRLESIAWPHWAPRVAFALSFGAEIPGGDARFRPPDPPKGVGCPLLVARLVSAIRGPVFLREAAPALSNLLNLRSDATPAGTWEIWLPVVPGRVAPPPWPFPRSLSPAAPSTKGTGS